LLTLIRYAKSQASGFLAIVEIYNANKANPELNMSVQLVEFALKY